MRLAGDLNGVLKGERKGLERVCEAISRRRRFAAGVDIAIDALVSADDGKLWIN